MWLVGVSFSAVCFARGETGRERVREISTSVPTKCILLGGWVMTGIGSPFSAEGMKKILYIQLTVLIIMFLLIW
jgi:hypothetical protein